jgi:hypothetical protein
MQWFPPFENREEWGSLCRGDARVDSSKGVRVRLRQRSCLRRCWVAADVRSLFAPLARFGMTRRFGTGHGHCGDTL